MAITRSASPAPSGNELTLTVNNGDFEALQSVVRKLGFKNEESALRFALAVLSKSATRSLAIVDKDGVRVNLTPSADLLKSAETVPNS